MIVLKIGGNNLDEPDFVENLAKTIAMSSVPIIIVHGGGKEISQMQTMMGLTPQYVDGLRVSNPEALQVAEMVLCGMVNTRIVRTLQLHGIEAQGLNGMDRGLIKAQKLNHPAGDLGRVGEATQVRADILHALIAQGVTPVIAPICLGDDGAFNVNADHVAGAVAKAIGANKVVFVTNVSGVLHEDELVEELTPHHAHDLIEQMVIFGGMLPKVHTALQLLATGIPRVMITNLDGLISGQGTTLTTQPQTL